MRNRIAKSQAAAGTVTGGGGDGGGSSGPVEDVFSTYLYTGEGGNQDIENGIDLDGEGGMVWTKTRELARSHYLFDTERGGREYLSTDTTAPFDRRKDGATFNSNGFTLSDGDGGLTNFLDRVYVSWTWRKAANFFGCIKYMGDGVAGRKLSHNLGCEVGFAVVKKTSGASHWYAQHKDVDLTGNKTFYFSTDGPLQVANNIWNSTHATSENLILGSHGDSNEVGQEYIAYLFAHDDSDESIIKCGSYAGNGNADGPEIDLGWEPQWVMIKNVDGATDWNIFDTMRGIVTGGDDARIYANESKAESQLDMLMVTPDGFKLTAANSHSNSSGYEYIYVAIRKPNIP